MRIDVRVTGASRLLLTAGTPLAPARWVGQPARLGRMDRLCALALVACDGALGDASLTPGSDGWDGERTAVVLGSAYGCHATNEEYYRGLLREGPRGASPRLFSYTLPSSPVGEISIHYGVHGPASTIANGLTSGIDAIVDGLRHLASGRATRVLVVAAEVASALLARLVGVDVRDSAAALVLERVAPAGDTRDRVRVHGAGACFRGGARMTAVAAAAAEALAEAALPAPAIARVLGAEEDRAALAALGVTAAGDDVPRAALAAAPLVALAAWLADAEREAPLLLVASDPEGAASAVVLTDA